MGKHAGAACRAGFAPPQWGAWGASCRRVDSLCVGAAGAGTAGLHAAGSPARHSAATLGLRAALPPAALYDFTPTTPPVCHPCHLLPPPLSWALQGPLLPRVLP